MVKCEKISSVVNSNYEFTHWRKEILNLEVGVVRFFIETEVDATSWKEILDVFLKDTWAHLENKYALYVFMASPVWIQDSKVNRYKGIWKFIGDKFLIENNINAISENCHSYKSKIRFTGIAQCERKNLDPAIQLLLKHQVGLLFAIERDKKNRLENIEQILFNSAIEMPDQQKEHLINIPKAIETILSESGIAIFPSGNEDFGGVYLDVFTKGKPENLLGCH